MTTAFIVITENAITFPEPLICILLNWFLIGFRNCLIALYAFLGKRASDTRIVLYIPIDPNTNQQYGKYFFHLEFKLPFLREAFSRGGVCFF